MAVNAGKGWGMNWDALYDSLKYLNTGGIWGTSHKFCFPLSLELKGSDAYRSADASGFKTLSKILNDVQAFYSKSGLQFKYTFT